MAASPGKTTVGLYLFFTGKRLWLAGGKAPSSYIATSGKNGKFDPIPNGHYWINQTELKKLEFWDDLSSKLMGDLFHLGPGKGWLAHQTGWGNYRIPIRQTGDQERRTGRGSFFIHGGDVPGSAGCIDLTGEMNFFVGHLAVETKWAKQERIPLYVDNRYE